MYRPWKTMDVKLVQIGIIPQDRSVRACRVFCMRNGIEFPGKKVIDENNRLIQRLDEKYSPNQKGIEMEPKTSVIAINKIRENPNNPRTRIESVEDLKASIKASGLLQPIAVRALDYCTYEVIAGSRRFQACKELGMKIIPCTVFYDVDDATAYELATAENIVRENMTAVDEANAVAKLFAQGKSRTEIGAMFGKSARWAEGRRKIVELGDKAMKALAAGTINLGHAEVLTMCHPEDVEKWLGMAKWKSPEELKTAIMNERPLLERAPFDTKKVCKKCEHRSDKQTDLFGDMQCTYCLNRECFEKNVKKAAETIRKQYIAEGYEEVPREKKYDAQHGWSGWYNAEDDDETVRGCINRLETAGEKPMFWVDEDTTDHGLVWCDRSIAFSDHAVDSDDSEDPNSWDWQMNHMDYSRREKVRKAASEEEKRIVADKLKGVFGNISNTAKAFILEALGCVYEDENGDTETYLKRQHDAAANFLDEVANHILNRYKGVDDDIREFLEMDSREEFERNAAAAIPEDDAEESDEDNLENKEE